VIDKRRMKGLMRGLHTFEDGQCFLALNNPPNETIFKREKEERDGLLTGMTTVRICICCGESMSKGGNALSRNPNLCASCSSMEDGLDESNVSGCPDVDERQDANPIDKRREIAAPYPPLKSKPVAGIFSKAR